MTSLFADTPKNDSTGPEVELNPNPVNLQIGIEGSRESGKGLAIVAGIIVAFVLAIIVYMLWPSVAKMFASNDRPCVVGECLLPVYLGGEGETSVYYFTKQGEDVKVTEVLRIGGEHKSWVEPANDRMRSFFPAVYAQISDRARAVPPPPLQAVTLERRLFSGRVDPVLPDFFYVKLKP